GLLLSSCGRSPDSQFYVLNPISPQSNKLKNYNHLRIGINRIHGPSYLAKPQLVIHCSAHEVKLEEYHRWVETLAHNTQRVIEANLTTLLPGAAFVSEPWDVNFKPQYQLQVDIVQFEVDIYGNSRLSADYLIYSENHLNSKGSLVYHQKVNPPIVANLVASMNMNLTHLTRDLGKVLASLK
nr:membrane integrity-associated transporter subunit PqiC [Tatlockia sp.]